MKTFEVIQFRFNNGKTRKVDVPNKEITKNNLTNSLNEIYYFGQNDFQPKNSPSVSVGDVILYNDEKHIVKNFGFEKITEEFFNILKKVSDSSDNESFLNSYRNRLFDEIGEKSFEYC